MKVAIFGGTGDMGRGLALRLAKEHDVVIGSREAARGESVAGELLLRASSFYGEGMKGTIGGASNEAAAEGCDVAVFAVPAEALVPFVEACRRFRWGGQVVLSPVARFTRKGGTFVYEPYEYLGRPISAAELVLERLKGMVEVVSGMHCVPASRLEDLKCKLGFDVPLAGERGPALKVSALLGCIEGLRPLYAGPLCLSSTLEALTPFLLNVSERNKLKAPGIRIVGEA